MKGEPCLCWFEKFEAFKTTFQPHNNPRYVWVREYGRRVKAERNCVYKDNSFNRELIEKIERLESERCEAMDDLVRYELDHPRDREHEVHYRLETRVNIIETARAVARQVMETV